MDLEILFSSANLAALTGWVALAVATFIPPAAKIGLRYAGFLIPVIFALAYVALVLLGREAFRDGGFSSLEGVRALFAHDAMLTAGWLHYLAFDLFVGAWIVREAQDYAVPRLLVVGALVLTFLFGPIGFLVFVTMRSFARRNQASAS